MHITKSFSLDVSYSQVAVFDCSLNKPFNFWTDKHVAQGFAWRPGSVSFGTLEEAGPHSIAVLVTSERADVSPSAVRAIQVPFRVPDSACIEVASIADSARINVPSQMYALRFEYFNRNGNPEPHIKFVFIVTHSPKFEILRCDESLSPTGDLLLTASPA
jgi:Competence protein J (ComJ)